MWQALGIRDFSVFFVSAVVLALTPGQDSLYVLGRTLSQGRGAGVASVVGILLGAMVHLLAGAAGLAALLAASPAAFAVVSWAGGLYLIYLGIRLLWASRRTMEKGQELPEEFRSTSTGAVLRQGFITNLLNPKVALFCLAFIPQFIRADVSHKAPAFLLLGLCFFVIGGAWLLCIVTFAAGIGGRLKEDPRFSRVLDVLAGVLFVALGLRMLWQR